MRCACSAPVPAWPTQEREIARAYKTVGRRTRHCLEHGCRASLRFHFLKREKHMRRAVTGDCCRWRCCFLAQLACWAVVRTFQNRISRPRAHHGGALRIDAAARDRLSNRQQRKDRGCQHRRAFFTRQMPNSAAQALPLPASGPKRSGLSAQQYSLADHGAIQVQSAELTSASRPSRARRVQFRRAPITWPWLSGP